jgi:hypothetical protein
MSTPPTDDATIIRDAAARAQSSPRNVIDTSRSHWADFTWPSLAFCAVLAGLLLSTADGSGALGQALDRVRQLVVLGPNTARAQSDRVLIVTSNPAYQRNIVATLSPRGFEPLLARDLDQAKALLAARGGDVPLAVLDDAVPDAAAIAQALRHAIPSGRIIVIKRGSRPEDIGHMLWERL